MGKTNYRNFSRDNVIMTNQPAGFSLPNSPEKANGNNPRGPVPITTFADEFNNALATNPSKAFLQDTRLGDINTNRRYDSAFPGIDPEEAYAQSQSRWSKAVNGTLKGVNLAATTFAGGFGALYGLGEAIATGRLSAIWDNPIMRAIDEHNTNMDQTYLPNFYKQSELDAKWYSPDNWFTANFLFDKFVKNTGFAFGAIMSGNVANSAILKAGRALGTGLNTLSTASKASETFKFASKPLRDASRIMSKGRNAEVANLLNNRIETLDDLTKMSAQLANAAKQVNMFAGVNDGVRKGLISLYSAGAEASFEAIQTGNEVKEHLIEEYKTNFRIEPDAKALEEIDRRAAEAGNTAFLFNVGILGLTENLQLNYLIGSTYRNTRSQYVRQAGDVILENGKWVAKNTIPKNTFGKLAYHTYRKGGYFLDPKEALQELSQFAVSVGTQNYFNKKYESDDADIMADGVLYGFFGRDEEGEGIGAFNSKEGIESGLLGALTGGLMQARQKASGRLAKKANTQAFISQLNKYPSLKEAAFEKLADANRGQTLIKQEQMALALGDQLEAKDVRTDAFHNYMMSRIKFGRADMIFEEIRDLREIASTKEGFDSLVSEGQAQIGVTQQQFLLRLTRFENTAKRMMDSYEALSLKVGSDFVRDDEGNVVIDKDGKAQRKYTDQNLEQLLYASEKIFDYEQRIPQVVQGPTNIGISIPDLVNTTLNSETIEELNKVVAEIEASDNIKKDDLIADIRDAVELAVRRDKFIKEYNSIINNPVKWQTPSESKIQEQLEEEEIASTKVFDKDSPKIRIKNKKGSAEYYLEKPYVVGFPHSLTAKNHKFFRTPTISIIEDNGDGTIKIQTEDGVIKDIDKSVLEQYDLFDPAQLKQPAIYDFFKANLNNVFHHKGLPKKRDGSYQNGRISFNPRREQLYFSYLDSTGKMRTKPVYLKNFAAQKGYKEAMIMATSQLTESEEATRRALEGLSDPNAEELVNNRLETLNNLFEQYTEKQQKFKELIASKKKQIESIQEKLNNLRESISDGADKRSSNLKFKKAASTAIQISTQLSNTQAQLEKEILDLESQIETADYVLQEILDILDIVKENPEFGNEDFTLNLGIDVENINNMKKETASQISYLQGMLKTVQKAIDSAISFLGDLISKFESKYPNVPRIMDERWVDFLKSNPNFLKIKPTYKEDLLKVNEQIAFIEDGEVALNEDRVNQIEEHLEILRGEYAELDKRAEARQAIVEYFEEIAEQLELRKSEEERLLNNEQLRKQFKGVLEGNTQSSFAGKTYELDAKKGAVAVVTAGKVGKDKVTKENVDHQKRVDEFSFKYEKLPNRESLRGRFITVATETASNVSGLINHFLDDVKNLDRKEELKSKTLLFLVVDENGIPVDKNGEAILDNNFDEMIYQVFPEETLQGDYQGNPSMFRESTSPIIVEALTEQYAEWREGQLNSTEPSELFKFKTSFGTPQFNQILDDEGNPTGKIDKQTKTSATQAGLITDSDLRNEPVLLVPTTTSQATEGTVTMNINPGGVVLRVPNKGLARVFNRKFSKKEAETMFDVLHHISGQALKAGELTAETLMLFDWLKSISYWGVPKNIPGVNSIWFEQVFEQGKSQYKLYMSGKQTTESGVVFTPTALEENRDLIISVIQDLYININAKKVNSDEKGGGSWSSEYVQITGIDSSGKLTTVTWPNYQSFLLSDKSPDKQGDLTLDRKKATGEELPLFTQYQPISFDNPINRTSTYMYLDGGELLYNIPDVAPAEKQVAQPGQVTSSSSVQPNVQQKILLENIGEVYYVFTKTGGVAVKKLLSSETINKVKENIRQQIIADGTEVISEIKDKDLEARAISYLENKIKSVTNVAPASQISEQTEEQEEENYEPVSQQEDTFEDKFERSLNTSLRNTIKNALLSGTEKLQAIRDVNGNSVEVLWDGVTENIHHSEKYGAISFKATNLEDIQISLENSKQAVDLLRPVVAPLVEKAVRDAMEPEPQPIPLPVEPENAVPPFMEEQEATEQATEETTETEKPRSILDAFKKNNGKWKDRIDEFRYKTASRNIALENWNKVEDFLKQNFPNIPVYIVKNIITDTNGREAWGMLQDGALYIYENAEIGTVYHEVFEAVWKAFTSVQEQVNIINEFRNREGSYYDVFSRTNIKYSEATNKQVKEQLAEEFADAVSNDKLGVKTFPKTLIGKLFRDIIDFIKGFFISQEGKSQIDELFNKIGNGYYSRYTPFGREFTFAKNGFIHIDNVVSNSKAEYKLKPLKLTYSQANSIVNEMLYRTISDIVQDGSNLFKVEKPNYTHLYTTLKERVEGNLFNEVSKLNKALSEKKISEDNYHKQINSLTKLLNDIDLDWDNVFSAYTDRLLSYGLKFDENDIMVLEDENNTGKSDYQSPNKIDKFRKANAAIKLLLATTPKKAIIDKRLQSVPSETYGHVLESKDKIRMTLINKLSESTNLEDMLSKLKDFASENPSYRLIYERLTKQKISNEVNYSILDDHNLLLLSSFWGYIKNQNPEVITIHLLNDGSVLIGDTVMTSASQQLNRDTQNKIIETIRNNKSGFFVKTLGDKYAPTKRLHSYQFNTSDIKTYTNYLAELGVEINPRDVIKKLNSNQLLAFRRSIEGIHKSLLNVDAIYSVNSKTLDISGQLRLLGTLQAIMDNPEFESTYYDINGERAQTFMNPNSISDVYNVLSNLKSLSELNSNTKGYNNYRYLLNDVFSKNSVVLKKMFDMKDPAMPKSKNSEELMKPFLIDGINDEKNGKRTESSKFNLRQRIIEELNVNFKGVYHALVPAEASLEYSIRMYNEGDPFVKASTYANDSFLRDFSNYLMDEIELARDGRKVAIGNSSDLRFFKTFLSEGTYKKVMLMVKNKNIPALEVYEANKAAIDKDIKSYIKEQARATLDYLKRTGIVSYRESVDGNIVVSAPTLSFVEGIISPSEMENLIELRTVNYIMANTEMFKIIFSDPYQYKDGLKRFKSFLSPRQSLAQGSLKYNNALNQRFNTGYEKDDIGYYNFNKNSFTSTTLEDVESNLEGLFGYYQAPFEETDGGGIITLQGKRDFDIRSGAWNEDLERQYRYDIAYEKVDKGLDLNELEQDFNLKKDTKTGKITGDNPGVMSLYTTFKPVVSGNTSESFNDIVLDKFALFPLSYRILHELNPNSNMLKMYEKLQKEKVDYAVFSSGRKVGSAKASKVYTQGRTLNTKPFLEKKEIPYSIIGLQTEVPTKNDGKNTRGTQITKLVTLDFLEAGVPLDFSENLSFDERVESWYAMSEQEQLDASPVFREVTNNRKLLEAKLRVDYESLLIDLGLQLTSEGYQLLDKNRTVEILKSEFLKREVSDNILDAIEDFKNNGVLLEATPAYQQIKNILYSVANNSVIRPKISGASLPQISSAMFEETGTEVKTIKDKNGKEKQIFVSSDLAFHSLSEDGKTVNVAEIMLARWFDSPLSDEQLIEFLNNTDEGQKILRTIAFRIPTQKQNSMDVFKVKRFLPKDFGGNVVVPSALVRKVGSDFDIDKLSLYLKNLIIGKDGYPKLVKLLDDSNSTTEQRYVQYVNQNLTNFRDVHKELSQEKSKVLQENVDEGYNEFLEAREEQNHLSNSLRATMSKGKEIFNMLPERIRDEYYSLEQEYRDNEFNAITKNIRYRAYTLDFISNLKALSAKGKTFKMQYNDKKTNKLIKTAEDPMKIVLVMDLMVQNYDEINRIFNISEKQSDNISKALDKARKNKSELTDAFKFELATLLANSVGMQDFSGFSNKPILEQNGKKALENAYMESLDALITHPRNFERLIVPNSATELESLSREIYTKKGNKEVDYKDVGNYINPMFMSKIRHDFVSGKYGVGIGAVSQTNHSQNQRARTYVDLNKAANIKNEDAYFLQHQGVGEPVTVNFQKFNKIKINGEQFPSLGNSRNAEGKYISDIIGSIIDGFVDIAKGPWIMFLGAKPNVVGTWLFLIKIGVPVRDVAYFMNQPIIQDYLQRLENKGYSWLFNTKLIEETISDYGSKTSEMSLIPDSSTLSKTLKYNVNPVEMSSQQKQDQVFYLKEFVKYSKMAEHLFKIQQATNYDTSVVNDPLLLLKKDSQLSEAQNSIISSANGLLESSHVGLIGKGLEEISKAFSEIIVSDKGRIREVMREVLKPHMKLQDREFLKVGKKALMDLFDWALHTSPDFNLSVQKSLVGSNNSTSDANRVMDVVNKIKADKSHLLHNNLLINALRLQKSDTPGKADNLSLINRDNSMYDKNIIISSFEEAKALLPEDTYLALVGVAITQSGLTNSPISFTQLVPYEDFKYFYNNAIYDLNERVDLADFVNLNVLERTNWNNSDIVGQIKAPMNFLKSQFRGQVSRLSDRNEFFTEKKNPRLKKAMSENQIPKVIALLPYTTAARKDFIVYTYEDNISYAQRAEMLKKKDFSFIKRTLMRKVYVTDKDGNRTPLAVNEPSADGKSMFTKHFFVAINGWGDSFRAREFYNTYKASVLNNGLDKIYTQQSPNGQMLRAGEVSDNTVARIVLGNSQLRKDYMDKEEENWVLQETQRNKDDLNCTLAPF